MEILTGYGTIDGAVRLYLGRLSMPIRFFCDHCKQMLKIGTSKVGSVIDCPRCRKSTIVPPQSVPLAEELYRTLKNKHSKNATPPTGNNVVPDNVASVPTWEELEEIDDTDMPLWMEESWILSSTTSQDLYPSSSVNHGLTEEAAIRALKKRYKLTVTLLNISLVISFSVGLVFGIFSQRFYAQQTSHRPAENAVNAVNEVTGVLYYLNENGERRADVEAVVICLPKARQPGTLLSCQGLRPEDNVNDGTVQMIHELGGMYAKADATGSFAFPYSKGVRYFVILISAHQRRTESRMKPAVLQELHRYFRDPERFGQNCLSTDEYEWSDGKHSLRYTFESIESIE